MGNCISGHHHRDQLKLGEEEDHGNADNNSLCLPKGIMKKKNNSNIIENNESNKNKALESSPLKNKNKKKQQQKQKHSVALASPEGDVTESSTDYDPNSPFSLMSMTATTSPYSPLLVQESKKQQEQPSDSPSGNISPTRPISKNDNSYNDYTSPQQQQQQSSLSNFNMPSPASPSMNNTYYTMSIEELNPPHSPKSRRRSRHHYQQQRHPAGRALQGRLQRARNMQSALLQSSSASGGGSIRNGGSSLDNHYYESSEEDESTSSLSFQSNNNLHRRRFHQSLSSKYSTLSNVSDGTLTTTASTSVHARNNNNNNNEKLVGSNNLLLSKDAIWAEIDVGCDGDGGAVLCTCLSRTKPSLSKSTPSFYLALGTASGLVQIQELLSTPNDDNVVIPATIGGTIITKEKISSEEDNNQKIKNVGRRFGPIHQIRVSGKIRSIDFSTDGKYLAVGGDDGVCSVFHLHYGTGTRSSSSGADNTYATESDDQLLQTECIATIPRIDRIYAVQFSPDNAYLAIGGFDGTVAIISTRELTMAAATNKQQDMIEPITEIPREGLILTIDWSPDSRYLAIGGSDKCCAIVDVTASWKVYKIIRRLTSIQSVKWYPNTGKYLAIGSSDVAIVVGRDSFTTISEIDLRSTSNNNTNIDDQINNNDNNSPNNANNEQSKDQFRNSRSHATTNSHRSVYRTNALCWSPNGSYFAVCGSDRKCAILETHSFTVVYEMIRPANITCVVWGEQNQLMTSGIPLRYLAIGGEDKKVIVVKAGIETNRGVSSLADDHSHSAASSSYFSNSNPSEWVLKEDLFHDMEDVIEVQAPVDDKRNNNNRNNSTGPNLSNDERKTDVNNSKSCNSKIRALAFSRGSKSRPSQYFAYATDDGIVTVRHVNDWKFVAEIQFTNPIQSLVFSNGTTNQYLVLGSIDSNVYISDTTSNFVMIAKIELTAPVTTAAFSKNNERLAVGSLDGTFAFFDPSNSFEFCGEIEVDDDDDNTGAAVLAVDWSSKNLAIGRDDGTVTVYDVKQVFSNVYVSVANIVRKAPVHSVAFGVSSRFLAVGGGDHCVGIYSSKGSWVLCHQVKMTTLVASVRWSPLGRYLACCNSDGILKVIDTIFWADVVEAAEAVSSTPILSEKISSLSSYGGGTHSKELRQKSLPSLAFSQDGMFLAFARGDQGMSVLNSSANWTVDFRKVTTNITSAAAESSSLSSYGEDNASSVDNHGKCNNQEISLTEDYYCAADHNNDNLLCEV